MSFCRLQTVRLFVPALLLITLLLSALPVQAQDSSELVASLEVLSPGVEVQRVDTSNWVPIRVETLIGEGDSIRTDATGAARVTLFRDGTSFEIDPGSEVHISEFRGLDRQFTLTLDVLAGITRQQINRLLDPGSSYRLVTPGATMTVRGTNFAVRVEESGRSSVITATGLVEAAGAASAAEVPPGFGLRAETGNLSEVVPATSFEELDAALDGCGGAIGTEADVLLNVRVGPGLKFERVGSTLPSDITTIFGTDPTGTWYRIPFRGGFGWVSGLGMAIRLDDTCPGIPEYLETFTEDVTRYTLIGDSEMTAIVNAETANLRSGPGTDYPKLALLGAGERVTIIGRNAEATWVRVRTGDGLTGWIAVFLVEINTDLGTVGVIPSESPATPTPEETPGEAPASTPVPTPTPAEGS